MTQDGWSFLRFIHSVTPSMTSLGHSHLVRRCLLLLLYLLALFCEREGEEVDSTPPPPLLPHTDRYTHLLSMALWDYIDCSGEHNTNLPPFPFSLTGTKQTFGRNVATDRRNPPAPSPSRVSPRSLRNERVRNPRRTEHGGRSPGNVYGKTPARGTSIRSRLEGWTERERAATKQTKAEQKKNK